MRQSLSNTVKSLQEVRLATVLKNDLLTGVSELAVCQKIQRKAPVFESFFFKCLEADVYRCSSK